MNCPSPGALATPPCQAPVEGASVEGLTAGTRMGPFCYFGNKQGKIDSHEF